MRAVEQAASEKLATGSLLSDLLGFCISAEEKTVCAVMPRSEAWGFFDTVHLPKDATFRSVLADALMAPHSEHMLEVYIASAAGAAGVRQFLPCSVDLPPSPRENPAAFLDWWERSIAERAEASPTDRAEWIAEMLEAFGTHSTFPEVRALAAERRQRDPLALPPRLAAFVERLRELNARLVVDKNGRAVTFLAEDEQSQAAGHKELGRSQAKADELIAALAVRKELASHERIIYDSSENRALAIRLLKQPPWPSPGSPNNTELFLMSSVWWFFAMRDLLGPPYARYYASLFADGVPGHMRAAGCLDAYLELPNGVQHWAAAWHRSGFVKIDLGAKQTAAFLLTDAPEDVRLPWDAASIVVPPGLCDPVRRIWCENDGPDGRVYLVSALDEAGNAFATAPDSAAGKVAPWTSHDRHEQLANLVRCVALAGQNGSVRKVRAGASSSVHGSSRTYDAPVAALWRCADPIELDLRDEAARAWSGHHRKGASPTVQFVVRGHFRDQVCGPQRTARKRIWIRPFWKGPEEARALLRRLD
jgi:hypothetical protein